VKTTRKDFNLFRREAEKWVPVFGITDWRISFGHQDYEDGTARAWYASDATEKICSIMLAKDWQDDEITDHRIKRCAFHEVFHVRLDMISHMLSSRGYNENEISMAIHEIIYVFENYFFGNEK